MGQLAILQRNLVIGISYQGVADYESRCLGMQVLTCSTAPIFGFAGSSGVLGGEIKILKRRER
jgi:hypothetical protein